MIIKQIPEDFIVDEIYNLDVFKDKDEQRSKPYYFFKLTKTNYNHLKAIEIIAKTFNTSEKLIHFAGIKDKVGITSQLISIYGIHQENFEKNLEYFNNGKDLHLEFLGNFKTRINLGDNLGNKFKITVRSLEKKDIEKSKENLKIIKKRGVLNFFDEQRFGYANNSHIVGKYVLQNNIELAVYEILTSLPQNPKDDLRVFVEFIRENFQAIKEQNVEIIDKAITIAPPFLRNEKDILSHLKKYKNDFPGAFRKLHKKLRTLYVNAYQSYLFNETIKVLDKENKLEIYNKLELINNQTKLDLEIENIILRLLEKDSLTLENFKLKHMPELKLLPSDRETIIIPTNIKISKEENDELNSNKLKVLVEFELSSGEYATNVVKQLFN